MGEMSNTPETQDVLEDKYPYEVFLYDSFLKDEIDATRLPEPKFGPIGKEVFERTYSRDIYVKDPITGEIELDENRERKLQHWWKWSRPTTDRTKETWADACRRIVTGSLALAPGHDKQEELIELFRDLYEMKITPAGRHLWVTGTGSPHSKNCWCAPVGPKTSDHFEFTALRLFEGGGVGSNYSTDLWDVTEEIKGNLDIRITCRPDHADYGKVLEAAAAAFTVDGYGGNTDPEFEKYTVEDTREGWAAAWVMLIDRAMEEGTHRILIDVSDIRKYGAPLRTFGGQASGPDPLVSACLAIASVLNGARGRKLTGLEAMEIDHQIAMSVVAGGTRRCLPWYTRVNTTRGSVQIKDIIVGDEVVTPKGIKKVSAVFDQGKQGLVVIKHAMGELECTPNHRVAVYDSLGTWTFKEAQHLEAGDHLVWDGTGTEFGVNMAPEVLHPIAGIVQGHVGTNPDTKQRFPEIHCHVEDCTSSGSMVLTPEPLCNTHYLRSKKWGDPSLKTNHGVQGFDTPALTADWAWLVGLLQGDGYVNSRDGKPHHVSFSVADDTPEVMDKLLAVLGTFCTPRIEQTKGAYKVVHVGNSRFADWCFTHVKQPNAPLIVPEWIFAATSDIRWAYLAGLFDADGSCKTRPLNIVTTVYHSLSAGVIRLLASMGVAASSKNVLSVDEGWQPKWYVNVQGMQNFEKVDAAFSTYSRKYKSVERRTTGNGGNFGFGQEFARAHGANAYGGSKNQIIPVSELHRQGHDLGSAFPSMVISVEPLPYQDYTYDIEVEDIHQFTAEGLVVHNSARMSLMHWNDPMIDEFLTCKVDPNKHWSTNISVEVDEDFRNALNDESNQLHEKATNVLDAITLGMARDGEPGIVDTSVLNIGEPVKVRMTNPCLSADSLLVTDRGLARYGDIAGTAKLKISTDLRISYVDEGEEKPENWKIEEGRGAEVIREASDICMTQPMASLVKVVTKEGFEVRLTPDHHIATDQGMVQAGDLQPGDHILITHGQPLEKVEGADPKTAEEKMALLMGLIAGDGSFAGCETETKSDAVYLYFWNSEEDKREAAEKMIADLYDEFHGTEVANENGGHKLVPSMRSDSDSRLALKSTFLAKLLKQKYGFARTTKHIVPDGILAEAKTNVGHFYLAGLFYSDGTVNNSASGTSIRLAQSNRELLVDVQRMLLANGIYSTINLRRVAAMKLLPDGKGGNKEYPVKDQHEVIINSGRNAFGEVIGFWHAQKDTKLNALGRKTYNPVMNHYATVEGVFADGEEPVFCLSEPVTRSQVVNGIAMRRCGEAILSFDPGDKEKGIKGAGESCNLGSVNMSAYGTDTEAMMEAFRKMARFLYRATMLQHPSEPARRIEDKNRRIGVGFLGLQGWCIAHGAKLTDLAKRKDLQDILIRARQEIRKAADELADELGTPRSVKVTAIAPTGTIAQISGAIPGMSPLMYKYFIRRVRFESNNPKLEGYAMKGYIVEDDVMAKNTSVVEFPMMDNMLLQYPDKIDLIEDSTDISFEQFMDLVAVVQNTFCGGDDGQAVSSTAQLPAESDPKELARQIKRVLGTVKGVTAFPQFSRPQMPYEALTQEQYEDAMSYIIQDEPAAVGDSNDGSCGTGGCPVV